MISGSLFAFSEYKNPREYGVLTEPDEEGRFWVRVHCEWLYVRYIPEIDDETLDEDSQEYLFKLRNTWSELRENVPFSELELL